MTTHGLPACPQCHQNTNVEQRKRPGCALNWFACAACEHAFCVRLPPAAKLAAIGLIASLAVACTTASVAGPTGPTLPAVIIVQDGERAPDPAGAADVASGSMTLTGPCEAEALLRSPCLDRSEH